MRWIKLPLFDEVPMWVTKAGLYQYIITQDAEGDGSQLFEASYQRSNAGKPIMLGERFKTFADADRACLNHWRGMRA